MSRFAMVVAVAVVLGLGTARAEDKAKSEAAARLEKLKALEGSWTLGDGKPAFVYSVVAKGSAVMEHLFPGTDHEMITMYHLDGDELVLTHYCGAGNQPRMKAKKGGDASRIDFDFAGGTNLDPAKDGHMHEASIAWKDKDHITSTWTFFVKGKKADAKTFELSRLEKK